MCLTIKSTFYLGDCFIVFIPNVVGFFFVSYFKIAKHSTNPHRAGKFKDKLYVQKMVWNLNFKCKYLGFYLSQFLLLLLVVVYPMRVSVLAYHKKFLKRKSDKFHNNFMVLEKVFAQSFYVSGVISRQFVR